MSECAVKAEMADFAEVEGAVGLNIVVVGVEDDETRCAGRILSTLRGKPLSRSYVGGLRWSSSSIDKQRRVTSLFMHSMSRCKFPLDRKGFAAMGPSR